MMVPGDATSTDAAPSVDGLAGDGVPADAPLADTLTTDALPLDASALDVLRADALGSDHPADSSAGTEAMQLPDYGLRDASPTVDLVPLDRLVASTDAGPCGPLINEIQTGGTASGADEFVEVYNTCPLSTSTSVSGWRLEYRAATGSGSVTLIMNLGAGLSGGRLAGGAYAVWTGSAFKAPTDAGVVPAGAWSSGVGLKDTGGAVALVNGTSIVDSVGWGNASNLYVQMAPAPAPPVDNSISRKNLGVNTHDNAADFVLSLAPTPGWLNSY
jgi:hypothetical protein